MSRIMRNGQKLKITLRPFLRHIYKTLRKAQLQMALRSSRIGKIGLHEAGRLWIPRSLKIPAFFDSRHLHIAWVADAASFHGG